MGALGIDPTYFLDDMSQEGFALAYQGWDESKRDSWEQARLIAYWSGIDKIKGSPSIEKFLPLQWDKQRKQSAPKSTKKRFQELDKKLTKRINNGK